MAIRELSSLRNPPRHQLPRDDLASDIDDRVWVGERPEDAQPVAHAWRSRTVFGWLTWLRQPGWEIAVVIAAWPLWWAVGFTPFIFPVLGFVLAWKMRGRRNLQIPRGFWIWLLFLSLVLISSFAINVDTPGTVHSSGIGRYIAFMIRFLNYAALTLMLLYLGNATEKEIPRRRIISWMVALCVSTVVLGTMSVVFPNAGFKTLISYVLPQSLLGGDSGFAKLAQVQPVLGETSPRPSAPFAFTNAWGNNLSLLLIWAVVAAFTSKWKRARPLIWVMLAVSMIPIVYSLNRGVWIGMIISFFLVGVRLAARGRMAIVGTIVAGLVVAGVLFAVSPLQDMVHQRIDTGHSNDIRASLGHEAFVAGLRSPFIGFGSTRQTIGSDASIVIGPSSSCRTCGYRDIGSTGQLWLLLISQGLLGVVLYFGFLARCVWNYRDDCSPIGIAGTLVIALEFFYSLFYNSLAMPLAVTMLSIVLLWRNQTIRRTNAEQT